MLAFRDFVPAMSRESLSFVQTLMAASGEKYDTFESAVEAAGVWIEHESVQVVSIETVVLPNIWESEEEGSADPALRTSGEVSSKWHQFIRVWYR
jgi:hypothetical protein